MHRLWGFGTPIIDFDVLHKLEVVELLKWVKFQRSKPLDLAKTIDENAPRISENIEISAARQSYGLNQEAEQLR